MINLFRIALAIGWLVMAWVTLQAGQQLGLDQAGDFFFGDMAHPWRAQFNIDFLLHLLLVGAWMIWSNANRALGLVFALLAVTGGAVFTFAYLLVRTVQTRGNLKQVLLGRHYRANQ
jgi:uncharacterized integral membrane protein